MNTTLAQHSAHTATTTGPTLVTPLQRLRAPAVVAAALASIAIAGCASAPPPTAQMAVAEASVQRASNASTTENAAAALQIAVTKLASARTAMNNKDYDLAKQLAEEAEVDSQVAELRAQSARSSKAAQESNAAARALREELERKR